MLAKQPNESEFEYHKRLVYGKLVDKTLADEDYSELAIYVYGKEYSSDVARRMMYGSCRTLQLIDQISEKNILSPDMESIIGELDEKKIELQKERQKFFDQRRELHKLISSDARQEHLYESLINAANRLDESVGSLFKDIPNMNLQYSDSDAILVFSDWHYGLVANNIFNVYNTKICEDRVGQIVASAIERLTLHKCRRLHIVVLGDLFHGAIHTSARVASEEHVCDQLMRASEILAQAIEILAQYTNETYVYTTYGNHARTVQNKNDSIHRDNMERIVPWWLTQRLSKYDNISIVEDDGHEFLFLTSCNHGFCASHGDNDSVRSSTRLLPTLFQKKYGRDIEYILLGDKHHRESYDELGVTAMLCGSLCGTDDYANNKRLYSEPSQLLLIVNEKCGVDAEYRLKCE